MRAANSRPPLDRSHQLRLRQIQADLPHRIFEQQPVFGLLDRVQLRADQLHAVLVEHARLGQRHRKIQSGLPADGRQQRVGPLAPDHLRGELHAERFHVGAVRQFRIGHDGGRIRIDQDHFVAVLAQRLARLRAGIIELAGLPDDDRPRAHDQNAVNVVTPRQVIFRPPSASQNPRTGNANRAARAPLPDDTARRTQDDYDAGTPPASGHSDSCA